jgi:hypothetical protein
MWASGKILGIKQPPRVGLDAQLLCPFSVEQCHESGRVGRTLLSAAFEVGVDFRGYSVLISLHAISKIAGHTTPGKKLAMAEIGSGSV